MACLVITSGKVIRSIVRIYDEIAPLHTTNRHLLVDIRKTGDAYLTMRNNNRVVVSAWASAPAAPKRLKAVVALSLFEGIADHDIIEMSFFDDGTVFVNNQHKGTWTA